MNRLLLFLILSIPVIGISWKTIFNIRTHGFYRLLCWECILWLWASNYLFWFDNPFSIRQIFSWILLFIAIYWIIAGVFLLKKYGKPKKHRNDNHLYEFEQTTELVNQGIYKYIRHPFYSSLLFLTWGIFLKNTEPELLVISVLSSIFIYLTAVLDEKECIVYFGEKYIEYMKGNKRFIPFIF